MNRVHRHRARGHRRLLSQANRRLLAYAAIVVFSLLAGAFIFAPVERAHIDRQHPCPYRACRASR